MLEKAALPSRMTADTANPTALSVASQPRATCLAVPTRYRCTSINGMSPTPTSSTRGMSARRRRSGTMEARWAGIGVLVRRSAARSGQRLFDLQRPAGRLPAAFACFTNQPEDERQLAAALGEYQERAPLAHGVTQAELVEHVGVGRGEIGNGVLTENQPLVHRLVNDAPGHLFVRPQRFELGL